MDLRGPYISFHCWRGDEITARAQWDGKECFYTTIPRGQAWHLVRQLIDALHYNEAEDEK